MGQPKTELNLKLNLRFEIELGNFMARSPYRFEARCLKDIVDKYEENLGFEKSFISILANRTKKQVDEIRRFYKKDFNMDLDADILK